MLEVSVIIITHNRKNYISDALDSAMVQSFKDFELIIVDDNSDDGTSDFVHNEYQNKIQNFIYIKNDSRQGISKSRNIALAKSSGKFIAVLDSDDVWSDPDKLKKQVEFLKNNPDHIMVGCNAEIIDEKGFSVGRLVYPEKDVKIREIVLLKNQFVHSGILFRKEAAIKAGGYDESLVVGEDYNLFLKLGLQGKLVNLSDEMVKYRRHKGNICLEERRQAFKDNIAIIKRYKNKYPRYVRAMLRRYVRYFIYRLFNWK